MHKYSHYLTHGDWQEGMSHDDHHQNNLDGHSRHNGLSNKGSRQQTSLVLLWSLIITFVFAIIEGVGGYYTHSIALQSDAIHMLTDAAGLLIAYVANNISKRPATVNLTFGYGNAEAIGALINCVFTLVLTFGLLFEVLHRFFDRQEVHGLGVFIIATGGLIVNLVLAFVLSRHDYSSLNIRAAFIHVIGDLLGSIVAIVAGAVIYLTGISIVDPILSLVVIMLLLTSNYNLIKKALRVLMAGVP
jgi:cobalt-zinc-cadmium efflux system protein